MEGCRGRMKIDREEGKKEGRVQEWKGTDTRGRKNGGSFTRLVTGDAGYEGNTAEASIFGDSLYSSL